MKWYKTGRDPENPPFRTLKNTITATKTDDHLMVVTWPLGVLKAELKAKLGSMVRLVLFLALVSNVVFTLADFLRTPCKLTAVFCRVGTGPNARLAIAILSGEIRDR